ncbi:MAG: hypothetical protein ACREP9_18245 [Candidatus Dormibacteraceae bacterium]
MIDLLPGSLSVVLIGLQLALLRQLPPSTRSQTWNADSLAPVSGALMPGYVKTAAAKVLGPQLFVPPQLAAEAVVVPAITMTTAVATVKGKEQTNCRMDK